MSSISLQKEVSKRAISNITRNLPIEQTQLVPFNGLTPNLHTTPEIILDENDEQLAEHQLREWTKISHISAGKNQLVVRYFNEFPKIPLRAKIAVWYPCKITNTNGLFRANLRGPVMPLGSNRFP